MKISLAPKYSGYVLPWSRREVSVGEIVEVPDSEGAKLVRKGKFFQVGSDEIIPGFSSGRTAYERFPEAWEGAEVLIKCTGGIGDCLIAASLSVYAKRHKCRVTMAVPKAVIPFVSFVSTVDDALPVSAGVGSQWDIVLEVTDFMKKGHELIREEVYQRVHEIVQVPVEKLKLPRIEIPDISRQIRDLVPSETSVAFHIGATAQHRRWPIDRWRTLCSELKASGFSVFLLGRNETLAAQKIGCTDCSHFPVGDQLNILARCTTAVCVDSCWLHLAGIMQKNAVGLYGPSRPAIWGARYPTVIPVTAPEGVCQGCHALRDRQCIHSEFMCMERIEVPQVLKKVEKHFHRQLTRKKKRKQSLPAVEPPRDRTEVFHRREKVLSVVPYEMLGGGEVVTFEVAKELEKYFDVTVAHLIGQAPTSVSSVVFAKKMDFDNYVPIHDRLMFAELLHENDVVLWYGTGVEDVPEMIRRCKQRPVSIPVIHTSFQEEQDWVSQYSDIADRVLCVNPEVADRTGGQFVPNMVDAARISNGKKVYTFDDGRPVVGFLGRFDDNKRCSWIVENLDGFNYNFLAQGESSEYSVRHLQGIAGDRAKILPYSDNVADFYASIDVLVLPSKAEGFPLVAAEAASLGIPAVVTENSALPRLFRDLMVYLPYEPSQPISALNTAVEQALKTDVQALERRAGVLCMPDEVGRRYRQVIRETLGFGFPAEVQKGTVSLVRRHGAGDILMATSVLSKFEEMFPKAKLRFETSGSMLRTVGEAFPKVNVTDIEDSDSIRIDIDYHESWKRGIHALEGMGGNEYEMRASWEPLTGAGRPRTKPRVACIMYQNHASSEKTKEWGEKNWKELSKELRKRGYSVSQLGSREGKPVRGFIDCRTDTIEEFISYVENADIVVGIEGITNHVGRILNKPCIILTGGSSSEEHTSYDLHTHVKTPSECRCWASICNEWARNCGRECMEKISVETVIEAIESFSDN